MGRLICFILGSVLLTVTSGCSMYIGDFEYTPRPGVTETRPSSADQAPPVVVLASVIGVRRDDHQIGIPTSVEVRLRLENNGNQTVVFDPQSLELVDGQLLKFPPPVARPPQPVTLEPGLSAAIGAFFPFPAGHSYDNTDLNSLQLRWTLQIGSHGVPQSVNFSRVHRVYYDPYWAYPPPPIFYGGFVIVHRR